MSKLQKPGEKPAKPGKYIERGPQGGKVNNAREIIMEVGDSPLPPTQRSKRKWEREK